MNGYSLQLALVGVVLLAISFLVPAIRFRRREVQDLAAADVVRGEFGARRFPPVRRGGRPVALPELRTVNDGVGDSSEADPGWFV